MEMIPVVSIFLEFFISLLALIIAFRKRPYMIGLAITFGIYVYYDLARLYTWAVSETILSVAFLIATISALVSMAGIFKTTLIKK